MLNNAQDAGINEVKMRTIDYKLLFSLFAYNEQTGTLHWLRDGKEAGWEHESYRVIEIDGTKIRSHIVIWVLKTGKFPEKWIDHKDRNRLNNKWDNLREADDQQNARNKSLHSNSTSGITGISWNKREQLWIAHITINYKTIRIGRYETKKLAAEARRKKQIEIFGEFSVKF